MSLLSFPGCRVSTTEVPGSLADVRLNVNIEQRTERQPEGRDPYEFIHVEVVLSDGKGAAIEKPEIKVLMNGEPLMFGVGTGNYYDRHPRYRLPDGQRAVIRPDTEYAFRVVWTDGKTYEAGTVRTPKALALEQITMPETHRAGLPLEITWRELAEKVDIVAFHGFEYPDEFNNMVQESGSVNADDVIRQSAGPGSGKMTVPASYFAAIGKKRVASFGIEVTRVNESRAAKAFSGESRIRAVRTVTYRAELSVAR